jgi:hypothetical protein
MTAMTNEEFADIELADQYAGRGLTETDLIEFALLNPNSALARSLYMAQAVTRAWAAQTLTAYRAAELSGNYNHKRVPEPAEPEEL